MRTVAEVAALAEKAHAGQFDKIGVPYIEHVRAVAAGLASFGPDLEMAGLLHDIIEDTDWTADQLRAAGVPSNVVTIVEAVTNQRGLTYREKVEHITRNPQATLVKIADNAHNSHPDRAAQLSPGQRERLTVKYQRARDVLWAAADMADVVAIVSVVNPALLTDDVRKRWT